MYLSMQTNLYVLFIILGMSPMQVGQIDWVDKSYETLQQSSTFEEKPHNPLFDLRGFNAAVMVPGDAMHTIGGVIFGLWKLIQGLRELPSVVRYEKNVNKRSFGQMYLSSESFFIICTMHGGIHHVTMTLF